MRESSTRHIITPPMAVKNLHAELESYNQIMQEHRDKRWVHHDGNMHQVQSADKREITCEG